MANAEPDEPVVESDAGITVEKSYEPDDFPVPAIAFVIHSERDEQASVRLVDTVPEEVRSEDVGFHPKYGAEFWEQEGDTITFTREFEPDEEFVTVYGIRGRAANDTIQFLTEPRLESVDPVGDADESEEVVRDVIGDEEATGEDPESTVTDVETDADADATATGEEADSADEVDLESDEVDLEIELNGPEGGATADNAGGGGDIEVPDAGSEADAETDIDVELKSDARGNAEPVTGTDADVEPQRETEPDADTASGSELASGDAESVSEASTDVEGSVVAALAGELRAADPDDEEVAALREALPGEPTPDPELRDRVETTAERLDGLESELEELRTAVEEATAEAADAAETAAAVREDVADLEALDPATGAEVVALSEDVERMETELADVAELSEDIERMEAELAEVVELRDRLTNALVGLGVEDDP